MNLTQGSEGKKEGAKICQRKHSGGVKDPEKPHVPCFVDTLMRKSRLLMTDAFTGCNENGSSVLRKIIRRAHILNYSTLMSRKPPLSLTLCGKDLSLKITRKASEILATLINNMKKPNGKYARDNPCKRERRGREKNEECRFTGKWGFIALKF